MNLEAFAAEREPAWTQLEGAVRKARGRPERLGPTGVLDLGRLYREAAADLAVARRRYPGDPMVARLERLVTGARPLVYVRSARRGELRAFFAEGYWRRVRERPGLLAAAWLLLLGPAALATLWALNDPGAALGLVPDQFHAAADPPVGGGITGGEETAFTAQLFTHNIAVTFAAFATGITGGVVTALLLAYNGVILGTVSGLAFGAGNGEAFVLFVAGHGFLELSCTAVCSAAGLRVGWGWVSPGPRGRLESLGIEARAAVEIVLGTMPWLVVAGFVEAFVRPTGLPVVVVLAIGLSLGGLYWGLVLRRGGGRPGQTRARRLASR